jgi:tripartite-type tricarboxylate transporter receptor subunit TctC
MRINSHATFAAVAAAVLVSSVGVAQAQSYSGGKNVRIVVGSSAGGGFDAFGRLAGRNLGQYLAGNPNIVVSNLPGAGSMKSVQSLKTQAADGTYMVLFNPGQVLNSLVQPKKVKMKFDEVTFIGSMTADARVCYSWHTTGIKTLDDLLKRKQFATGHTGKGASNYIDAAVLKNVFGANLKQIIGYPGSAEQRLAVEKGELDGDCGSYDSIPENWIKDKKINIFIRVSKVSIPEIANVPSAGDLAKGEKKKIVTLLTAHSDIFRPLIVSKKTPADKVAALRKAMWDMVNGKPFLDDAKRSGRSVIAPMKGEDIETMINDLYATPAKLIAEAAQAVQ